MPGARAEFRRFIGVALGGGRGKSTAVARLELHPDGAPPELMVTEATVREGHRGSGPARAEPTHPPGVGYLRDEDLVAYLRRWADDFTLVACDAPLTLPPCSTCGLSCPGTAACAVPDVTQMRAMAERRGGARGRKPTVTPYTQRLPELVLAAEGLPVREALGQSAGPLTARAARLRRMMSPTLRLHENLIEVEPRGALVRMFGAKAARAARVGAQADVRMARARMLEDLRHRLRFRHVWPELVVRSRPVFRSVITAFVGSMWAREPWAPATQVHDSALAEAVARRGPAWLAGGWIWIPPEAEGAASGARNYMAHSAHEP